MHIPKKKVQNPKNLYNPKQSYVYIYAYSQNPFLDLKIYNSKFQKFKLPLLQTGENKSRKKSLFRH